MEAVIKQMPLSPRKFESVLRYHTHFWVPYVTFISLPGDAVDGQVTREFPGRRVRVVASFSKDKEITECLAIMLRHSGPDKIHFAEVRNEIVRFFFSFCFS